MDVNTLMKVVLSPNATSAISASTGIPADQIKGVVNNIMPMLLSGVSTQAAENAESFNKAMDDHAGEDTRDLAKFLGGVDLADGAKIVQHLLGANQATQAEEVAKASGLKSADVKKIMAIVAPLLLSILGQQKKKHGLASILLQTVAGGKKGVGVGDMIGLLGKLMK